MGDISQGCRETGENRPAGTLTEAGQTTNENKWLVRNLT